MRYHLTPSEKRKFGNNKSLRNIEYTMHQIQNEINTERVEQSLQYAQIQDEKKKEIYQQKYQYNQKVIAYNTKLVEREKKRQILYALQQKIKQEKKEKEKKMKALAWEKINVKKNFSLGKITLATITGISTLGFIFS